MYDISLMDSEDRVILLVGPTGVGKTGASLHIAEGLRTEIIGADSMQIYQHMDIGTEKPTPGQLSRVRHHMVDFLDPADSFSSGQYIKAVTPIIEGLHAKDRIPLVVGGTGLYIKAMTMGLFEGPDADWQLRGKLKEKDVEDLYDNLNALDPVAASEIMPADKRRIIRALEVCIKTGRPISEIKRTQTRALPYRFIKLALMRQRRELYAMIEKRVDQMFERGLVDEVSEVLKLNPSRTPMQAIGYKEIAAHLKGEYPLDDAVRLIKRNTRRYAKRQFTWFNNEPELKWIDITGIEDVDKIAGLITLHLKEQGIPIN
jgi:tRNA dimethylallyltransferase